MTTLDLRVGALSLLGNPGTMKVLRLIIEDRLRTVPT